MEKSNRLLSELVTFRTYAKHLPTLGRREMYDETIARSMNMHLEKFPKLSREIVKSFEKVFDYRVCPSMRALQFGGEPVLRNNVRGYNCAFMHLDSVESFGEMLFLLLSGTGVGFSCQKRHVNRLPMVQLPREEAAFWIPDSIEGWAEALDTLMRAYFYSRTRPQFNFSQIREKGSYLSNTGAKAPGPLPLKKMLEDVEAMLKAAVGRRLKPIECHDISCRVADCVLAGGIRRAALISLFDATDEELLNAKQGSWWEKHPYRARANNCAVLKRDSVTKDQFRYIYDKCIASNSGEPGIAWTNDAELGLNPCLLGSNRVIAKRSDVSRYVAIKDLSQGDKIWSSTGWTKVNAVWPTGVKPVYRYSTSSKSIYLTDNHKVMEAGIKVEVKDALSIDRCRAPYEFESDVYSDLITKTEYYGEYEVYDINVDNDSHTFWCEGLDVSNCAEISLNSNQFCNLTSINQTGIKDKKDWLNRVYAATLIGTLQASYTSWPFLRPQWKATTELEALLGVSCTGIADAGGIVTSSWLQEGAALAVEVNDKYAKKIGINSAARITTVKPEGSASCTVGSSSGIHARHSEYYLRRIRINRNDALALYLLKSIPELIEDDVTSAASVVVTIPQKSPKGAITREQETAKSLFDRNMFYQDNWIAGGHISGKNKHNVSVTISYRPEEVEELFELMWENRSRYTAISLLPYSDHTYVQAPFEECSEETYNRLNEMVQDVDFSQVIEFDDNTSRAEIVACAGGFCELV